MNTLDKISLKSDVSEVVVKRVGNGYQSEKLLPPSNINFIGLYKRTYGSKRIMDVVLGSVGLVFFILIYPIIAMGIKLSSKGPVFYYQTRTGFRGKPFKCIKFRTMHNKQKVSANGIPIITKKNDNRIFWFGQMLRKLNLDELPQLINVVKGEMSLVGPRPYPVEECGYWNNVFEDHYYRYLVYPGITGQAQVKGYRGGTLDKDHMRKRLDHDLIYTEKKNFLLDMMIIIKTFLQMLNLNNKGH